MILVKLLTGNGRVSDLDRKWMSEVGPLYCSLFKGCCCKMRYFFGGGGFLVCSVWCRDRLSSLTLGVELFSCSLSWCGVVVGRAGRGSCGVIVSAFVGGGHVAVACVSVRPSVRPLPSHSSSRMWLGGGALNFWLS